MERLAYPINDFCRMLGVGRTKGYELVNGGRVETIRIGRRRLVTADSMKRLVEQLADEAA